jgi:hypothetical protein
MLRLLVRDDRLPADFILDVPERDEDGFSGVRCPRCGWRPTRESLWSWNTFATRGLCPGCAHQWQWTSCHRCEAWSPHDDWYENSESE